MYRAWYEASEFLALPLVSAFLFLALFLGMLAWVLLSKRESYSAVSALPLHPDDARSAALEVKP